MATACIAQLIFGDQTFLKPVTVSSGMLRCAGTVISRGRRHALAEARLYDEQGQFVAHGTSSCLLFEVR